MPATLTEESLNISNLRVSIGGSAILRGINLTIRPNSVFCLMGRNGVGKSTTLKALIGLYPIDSGEFELQGKSITRLSSADRARSGLGYVPQGREIFPLLTKPKSLILDEPTEGIQPNIIDQIGDAIKMLRTEGEMSDLTDDIVKEFLTV